jgi:hypothetical protein
MRQTLEECIKHGRFLANILSCFWKLTDDDDDDDDDDQMLPSHKSKERAAVCRLLARYGKALNEYQYISAK